MKRLEALSRYGFHAEPTRFALDLDTRGCVHLTIEDHEGTHEVYLGGRRTLESLTKAFGRTADKLKMSSRGAEDIVWDVIDEIDMAPQSDDHDVSEDTIDNDPEV